MRAIELTDAECQMIRGLAYELAGHLKKRHDHRLSKGKLVSKGSTAKRLMALGIAAKVDTRPGITLP